MFPKSFISASYEYNTLEKKIPAPYMRRTFNICGKIDSAEFVIGTGGYYVAYINGINITKGALAPYRSNPDHFIFMDKYDVRAHLKEGKNVIALVLGNGIQNSLVNHWNFQSLPWSSSPKVCFALKVRFQDGSERIIESDLQTVTYPSPIVFNDFHIGEHYDARKEICGWSQINFDDSNWSNVVKAETPRGEKCFCEAEPIIVREERKPISVVAFEHGYIYDFGLNDAGVCRLKIKGKSGQEIILRHFETLVDDKPYYDNIRFNSSEMFQEDKYICYGESEEEFVPKFTYHGFRYVYVIGIEPEQANNDLLTYLVMSSNIKSNGTFVCDNEVVNKIQEATVRSDLSNFFYFPTDCPQREKNGWTADASLSAEQMLLNFKPENSYKVWLKNIYKSINDKGQLPGIIPTATWGYSWGNGPGWDNVLVNLPYYTYLYRGDKSIFSGIHAPLMRYLTYLYSRLDNDSLIAIGLGDWCQPNRMNEEDYTTPLIVTDSILTVDIARKAAFIFEVLEMSEQKYYAEELGKKVKKAIRNHLIDSENCQVLCNTQSAQAMAIYYDIFEKDEVKNAVKYLVRLISENNYFMDTGVLGGRVIFRVLAENGFADLAYKMITRPEFPSYGNWIKRGATTLWEAFWREKNDRIMSMNHHFWGDVSAWFYLYLAGIHINPSGNNVNEVIIKPCFLEKLNYVYATQEMINGMLCVEWKCKGNIIDLVIELPENTCGKMILNEGYKIVGGSDEKVLMSGKNQYHILKKY